MVSFRKFVMVMALLVIVAGIALAQAVPVVQCNQYNQQTARLRQESQTELVPALTFACTVYNQLTNQGSPVQAGTLYDWEVFFPTNAPLTSSPALHGGATEPQLMIDVYNAATSADEGPTGPFYAKSPPVPGGIYPGNGTSGGSVIFAQVNMNPNGDHSISTAPDTVYVTITGLRVSALMLASNPPNYGGPLVLTVWAKPSQTRNAANQTNPGNIFVGINGGLMNEQPTISAQLGYAAPSLVVTETGILNWRQCFSWSMQGQNVGSNNDQYFHVDFTELYSYAFSPPTDGWEDPYPFGGTRIAFTFSMGGDNGWPNFIGLWVPQAIEVLNGSSVVVEAVLVTGTDAMGNGGTVLDAPPDPIADFSPDTDLYSGGAAGNYYDTYHDWVPVDTTNGMVVYQILPGAQDAVTTTLEVPVDGEILSTPTLYPPPDNPSANVVITMAGYAPWTPGPSVQSTPIPRFVTPPQFQGGNLIVVDACITNLLYPYVVAGMGWDTGLTVANTGMDPFGTFSGDAAKPNVPGTSGNGNDQPGVCWVYFYGSFDRGAPLVTNATNPPNPVVLGAAGFGTPTAAGDDPQDYIQPGTTSEDLVLKVLALNYPSMDFNKHSWNGYAIAQCDFLYAHGYAFTVYHDATFKLGGNLSLGYLALVFDQRGINHPSQKPEKMTF